MQLALRFEAGQLDAFAGALPSKLAYATRNALNATVKRVQQAGFSRVRSAFTIRDQRLFFGSGDRPGGVAGRVTHWAKLGDEVPFVELTAGTMGKDVGQAEHRRLLFSMFEEGGMRKPFTPGAKGVAEPVLGGARPSKPEHVLPALTFSQMQLQAYYKGPKAPQARIVRSNRHRRSQGMRLFREYGRISLPSHDQGIQWKGRAGTYIMFSKAFPLGAVMQRIGSGRGMAGRRLAWVFDRPYQISPDLHWLDTATSVAQATFATEVNAQINDMLEHEMSRVLR